MEKCNNPETSNKYIVKMTVCETSEVVTIPKNSINIETKVVDECHVLISWLEPIVYRIELSG